MFEGRKKFLPLPMKHTAGESPFQQWGLDFIGEDHPTSYRKHKRILIKTNYFIKWIEATPTKKATNMVIIQFLEGKILSHFSCPQNIITDNATTFRSKKMIEVCHKYNIVLGNSTAYYPQGNGLAESSNKILENIIKKMLQKNKKSWHKKLVHALWADRVSTKKSIGMSPFQMVHGTNELFQFSLGVPVMMLL